MPKIITDDETLRGYIPNVFDHVETETSLFDKMLPFLEVSETWLISNLLGVKFSDIAIDDQISPLISTIVVSDAFARAVPSLDLVLTPNGFGIVNNNNLVPASKERVERLIQSLVSQKSAAIAQLIPRLRIDERWHDTAQCKWLSRSCIQDINDVSLCERACSIADKWSAFIELRNRASEFEHEIMVGWLSPELIARLYMRKATGKCAPSDALILFSLHQVVINAVKTGCLNKLQLEDLVNLIRNRPEDYPEWHGSATSRLFSPATFVNSKKSGGYFF